MINCVIAGVGGQGTVLLSRLIGAAAIARGMRVRGSETIGMAQRGGSVVSHVRMGEAIHSPLIPRGGADVLIAFEPGEAVRALPLLREGGAAVVCNRAIRPVTSSLGGDAYAGEPMMDCLRAQVKRLTVVDGEALIKACDGARTMNVALLGVAVGLGLLPFSVADVEAALAEKVPPRYQAMNRQALQAGLTLASGHRTEEEG